MAFETLIGARNRHSLWLRFLCCMLGLGLLTLGGCQRPREEPAVQTEVGPTHREMIKARLRFVVDRGERTLTVYREGRIIGAYKVAVGMPSHPTPTGTWDIFRVDLNPDWTPPDSEWAADDEPKPPGHPGNPMGRARLVYNPPYTIHGTDELDSLGKAASHGSIRVANEAAIELARILLEGDGAWKGQDWFDEMLANPTRMYPIRLEAPASIEVVESRPSTGTSGD
jgi:hypothetical protein